MKYPLIFMGAVALCLFLTGCTNADEESLVETRTYNSTVQLVDGVGACDHRAQSEITFIDDRLQLQDATIVQQQATDADYLLEWDEYQIHEILHVKWNQNKSHGTGTLYRKFNYANAGCAYSYYDLTLKIKPLAITSKE